MLIMMKIDKVTFEGKYSVNTQFLDVILGAEAFLDEGQTMEQGYQELKERSDAFIASLKKSSAYFNPETLPSIDINDR